MRMSMPNPGRQAVGAFCLAMNAPRNALQQPIELIIDLSRFKQTLARVSIELLANKSTRLVGASDTSNVKVHFKGRELSCNEVHWGRPNSSIT